MPKYIFQANIEHFKKLIRDERDARKRETLKQLLAEEKAKLARYEADQKRKLK